MATDIVPTLFGLTPEMYQRQQDALLDKQALQFAQLDPFQQATYGIFRGASQLGGALGRALGGEDPELARISLRNQVAREIDPTSLESFRAGIQKLAPLDPQGAMMLADTARKAASEMALAKQRGREGAAKSPLQELLRSGKYTPASIRAYAETGDIAQLVPAAAEDKATEAERNARTYAATKGKPDTPEYATAFQAKFEELIAKKPTANIKEVGVAQGSNKAVYLDVNNNEQFVFDVDAQGKQVRRPYVGGVDRTTAKVSATSQNIQENEFSKQLGKAQADRYAAASSLRDNAIAALNTFTQLSKLDEQGLISGTFATGRVGATNLLNTLGLVAPDQAEKLARSENYQKVAGDAILATLGGKLGAGFSNEDRKFIQGLVPQLENSPLARRQLIDFMIRKNQSVLDETTRLMNFAEQNRTLSGFTPSIPLPGATAAPAAGAAAAGTAANPIKLK